MKLITRILPILLILVLATVALAVDPEPQLPKNSPESGINAPDDANSPLNPAKVQNELGNSSPMMNEIRTTMDISKGEIAELSATAAGTSDFAAKQTIQITISEIKKQTELDILAIQVSYARAAGNEELALEIEAAIAAINSPPTPTAPAEPRPAPVNQN